MTSVESVLMFVGGGEGLREGLMKPLALARVSSENLGIVKKNRLKFTISVQ